MLNTLTSVDSLPRLRRFNSSQTQQSPFAYLGHDEGLKERHNQDLKDEKDDSKTKEETVAKRSNEEEAKEKINKQIKDRTGFKEESKIEIFCQPVSEIKGGLVSQSQDDTQERKDLVNVPLSRLKPPGGRGPQTKEEGETGEETFGDDQKMCCGFFFKVSWSPTCSNYP